MSEIKNGRLGLYGTKHSNCNHVMTLGSKGLALQTRCTYLVARKMVPEYKANDTLVTAVNTRINFSSGSWVFHISWSKCCLCVCVSVCPGWHNYSCCSQRLVVLHAQTNLRTTITTQKRGWSGLLYWSKSPQNIQMWAWIIFKAAELHSALGMHLSFHFVNV